jgi:branched-chain amino acid transport system permease protein
MRVVNMAYGAYYLLGGYIGLSIVRAGGSFELAMLGGGLSIVVLGFLIDRFLIRRTGNNHLAQVLLTVGIAFVIGEVCLAIWGGDSLKIPLPSYLRGSIVLPGDLYYPKFRFALIIFGIVAALSLWLLYHKTQIGAVVRAGVDDREMVTATGINIDRLFVLVSALGSFLAGVAGVVGGAFLTLNPGAEWDILVFALVVVIIGGLGSLEGAILGSIIVGLLDAYGRWLLPEFSYFVLFGPMAVLLLFRVTGIFGKEH